MFDYNKAEPFLHCSRCLTEFYENPEGSVENAMAYQASGYRIEHEDKPNEYFVVLWCKKCKQEVWNSRHLMPIPDDKD